MNKWLEEERNLPDRPYGLIARTNAAEATKEEFLHELNLLKKQYEKQPSTAETAPATAFYMNQNRSIWQQSATFIHAILMRSLQTSQPFTKKFPST